MNTINKIIKKYINPNSIVSKKNRQIGSSPIDSNILAGSITTANSTNGIQVVPGAGYSPYTYPNMPSPGPIGTTTTTGTTMGQDFWTTEEKEALAKIGFKYNKEKTSWELNLSTTISVPQLEEILGWAEEPQKPSDRAINAMKQLKKQLIKKLTAKIILLELIKPHEIKE